MNFLEIVTLIFMVWIALYSIIGRVCICLERRADSKNSYAALVEKYRISKVHEGLTDVK